ncbi:hypothetical protein GPJ56_001221 [Histomonas meleagridis]|uniref:uncharacterized protein n=1 Tax=Histomonas meleagridis TaxID=135588 RepID=UPI00355968C9|nr:hypothetical protein GPJ56_001221 [Histomonas meleagridis]KAH0797649.1 hypothetical protein GO595_009278 [Histomonas meleagridis]
MDFRSPYQGIGRTIGETPSNANNPASREYDIMDDQDAESDLEKAIRISLMESQQNSRPNIHEPSHSPSRNTFIIEIPQEIINNIVHNPLKLRPILAKLPGVDQFNPIFDEFFNS